MEFSKVHFLGLFCSYYTYIANRKFEGFSSVLNLLISHMKWIASSNEVAALDKTNIINCITNNSTPSALHICYFATYFCTYNKFNDRGKLWKRLRYTKGLTCQKNKYCHFVVSHNYWDGKFMKSHLPYNFMSVYPWRWIESSKTCNAYLIRYSCVALLLF